MLRCAVVSLGFFVLVRPVLADSWAPAKLMARMSEDGAYVVRVVPGKSMGDVFGYAGRPQGPYATAEWYHFKRGSYMKVATATLLNPIAPIDIEVSSLGFLVAIDNWHNLGIRDVVSIYSPDGKLVRALKLTDLYSPADLSRIESSTSSIHWRCESKRSAWIERNERELWIIDSFGGQFVFQLKSGSFEYKSEFGACKR